MKKIIILLIFIILLISLTSAEIIINQQPNEIYNLDDTISIPVTVKSSNDISGIFQMDLICSGHQINFYKNGVGLSAGEEKKMDASLVLIKSMIGEVKGLCKIKAIWGENYVLTNDFKISNLINLHKTTEEVEFNPGENFLIEGGAVKENGEDVNGFINMEMILGNSSVISQLGTINNGFFSLNISLPNDMKAGQYLVKLDAYETNRGKKTNVGFMNYNVLINQIPTSLEIVFAEPEVEPGTNLKIKIILHDQTGEKISANAIIIIKDEKDKILEQIEKPTDEILEFPIAYNEPPEEWTVVATSNEMESEITFNIKEKEEIKIELLNKTIILTNMGNVPYNKTILIKIENESINIDAFVKVDETKKYTLTAPDGEYQIEIITNEGSKITSMTTLTGKTIDVKEAPRVRSSVKFFSWFFIIAILGFVTLIFFKKRYKKSFFGYILSKKKARGPKQEKKVKSWLGKSKAISLKKDSIVDTKNRAELSLSLKGDKQNVSVVCLKIKNLEDIESKKGNAKETLQKIVDVGEKNKAAVYENQDNLIFILAPVRTRTFKNEKIAVEVAQKIEEILKGHNKLFNQKINFGISLNYGTIVAKQETTALKFMAIGTLITTAKKISSLSNEEILLSEKINERLKSNVKTQKHTKEGVIVYTIQEVRHRKGDRKFISEFLKRLDRDKGKEKKK